jgi:ribosomal protein S12 methylthiotransferase
LGCPKNLIDSERILGLLDEEGYAVVDRVEEADYVVVNTCGFIESARQESLDVIRQLAEAKTAGHIRGIVVAGCLAERDREALFDAVPEIDLIVGVFSREEIGWALKRLDQATRTNASQEIIPKVIPERIVFHDQPKRPPSDSGRLRVTPDHIAYLRIAEGCDRTCAFCTIPSIRGTYSSKPIELCVEETRELVDDGVRELVVVAQDTNYYGLDLYGEPSLDRLLGQLDQIRGIEWIRLMYLYPSEKLLTDRLIDRINNSSKILPYLDLPLQHINDEVLRRMRRHVTRAETESILARVREKIKGLVLRTTLIAGFPGETEEQFEELRAFVEQENFERLGVFPYSDESGTTAMELDEKVDPEEVFRRYEILMQIQQERAFAWNQRQVGRQWDVILDCYIPEQGNAYIGRTTADAPDVDGVVYVTGQDNQASKRLRPGQIVRCEIVATEGYDLIGVAVGKPR